MGILTENKVKREIEPFRSEWLKSDWWFGSTDSYNNTVHGFDVSVLIDEDTNIHAVSVYELFRNQDEELEIGEILFMFNIK